MAGDDDSALSEIVLTYDVKIIYSSVLNAVAEDVYNNFVSSLMTALTNGNITASLQESGEAAFTSATISEEGLEVSDFTVQTISDSDGAESGGIFSTEVIALIVIILILVVTVCVFLGKEAFKKGLGVEVTVSVKVAPAQIVKSVKTKPRPR